MANKDKTIDDVPDELKKILLADISKEQKAKFRQSMQDFAASHKVDGENNVVIDGQLSMSGFDPVPAPAPANLAPTAKAKEKLQSFSVLFALLLNVSADRYAEMIEHGTGKALTAEEKQTEYADMVEARESATDCLAEISALYSSKEWITINTIFPEAADYYNTIVENMQADDLPSAKLLATSLMQFGAIGEYYSYDKTPPADGQTLQALLDSSDGPASEEIRNLYIRCLERAKQTAAAAGGGQEGLERLYNSPAEKYIMLNNAISNVMTSSSAINTGYFDLPVWKKGSPGEVTAYTIITLDPKDSGLSFNGRPFTEYDRCVLNAVVSQWEANNRGITPEAIYRTMTARDAGDNVSPQSLSAITKSLEKMRYIKVYSDVSEEMKKRKLTLDGEPVTSFVVDGFLLSLEGYTFLAGGRKKKGYKILSEPILLKYSKANQRLLTFDSRLMDIKKVSDGKVTTVSIANTAQRQTIKEYLLKRIAMMKYDRRQKSPHQSNRILMETLLSETGAGTIEIEDTSTGTITTKAANKVERARIINYIKQVLDYYAADGYINGYKENKERRSITGFDIDF